MNNILHAKALATIFGATDEIKQEVNISFFYQYNPYSSLIEVEGVTVVEELNFEPSDLRQDLTVAVSEILVERESNIAMCGRCKIKYSIKPQIVYMDRKYETKKMFI